MGLLTRPSLATPWNKDTPCGACAAHPLLDGRLGERLGRRAHEERHRPQVRAGLGRCKRAQDAAGADARARHGHRARAQQRLVAHLHARGHHARRVQRRRRHHVGRVAHVHAAGGGACCQGL